MDRDADRIGLGDIVQKSEPCRSTILSAVDLGRRGRCCEQAHACTWGVGLLHLCRPAVQAFGRTAGAAVFHSLVRVTAAWPWLALGTVMKFVIGNRLTPAVTLGDTHPTVALLTAAIFELKFYFDFAGYSFIGYGGALLFGFRISRNFTHPFLASNVVLFWRRWHMSLGRFLARYLLMTLVRCSRWARSSSANASRRRGMVRSVPCRVPCSSRVTGVFC